MSLDDLSRLIAERSLVRAEFEDADVAGFWAKATFAHAINGLARA